MSGLQRWRGLGLVLLALLLVTESADAAPRKRRRPKKPAPTQPAPAPAPEETPAAAPAPEPAPAPAPTPAPEPPPPEPAPEPAPPPPPTSDELMSRGKRHLELREWDAAIESFKQAYKLDGTGQALIQIGIAHQSRGDCVQALDYYTTYQKTFPKGEDRAWVQGLVDEVKPCAKSKQPGTQTADDDDALGAGVHVLRGTRLSFYGLLRLDGHYTDSSMNDPRFAMWANSTENLSFVQGMNRREKNKNPTFVMHPRLSRLGVDAVAKPLADGLSLSGKLEFDFFAGENESRALPRLRHVYGQLTWGRLALLFGQTTDVVSPLIPSVNAEAVMWNAGNLGDRQPQVQLAVNQPVGSRLRVRLQAAAGQEGARTNQDLDGDGILDGDLAERPQAQGRAGLEIRHWTKEPIAFGAWTVYGAQRLVLLSALPIPVSDRTDFSTFAIGGDVSIPVTSDIKLQGEVWQGKNLADLRGGIGQLIDIRTGTELRAIGGWAELLVRIKFWRLSLGGGVDRPYAEDVQQRGQRSQNRVLWVGNLFSFGAFALGVDYSRWRTEWVRLNTGKANRYSMSLVFTF